MSRTTARALTAATIAVLLAVIVVLVVVLVRRSGEPSPPRTGPSASPSATGGPSGGPTGTPSVPMFAGSPSDSAQRELLGERVGFGGGVTGGAGGRSVVVTSAADSGAGTLREALSGDGPRWVTFAKDMTIRVDSPLEVGSDTTIDGRGKDVEINGPGTYGLRLKDVSNVIVESLTLRDFGDVTRTAQNDEPDAINVDGVRGLWIDHDDLSMAGDKLIGVTGKTEGLTVSWNHFHDQLQTFQLGNQSNAAQSAFLTVTVDHNFFDRVGYRMPVVSYGKAHVYDNYYLDWKTYAVRSERDAQVYLEDNVFVGSRSRNAVRTNPGGNGCNDSGTRCDKRPGNLLATGNVVQDAKRIRDVGSGDVFDPAKSYRYTAQPAGAALVASVQQGVGPR